MGKTDDDSKRSEIAKDFGKNLLKIRKDCGFTREELAEKSNLSSNYIYGLETGTYLPGCIALIDLANVLNVSTSQLLDKYLDNSNTNIYENINRRILKLSDNNLNFLVDILNILEKYN